jgi:hypothetical protein
MKKCLPIALMIFAGTTYGNEPEWDEIWKCQTNTITLKWHESTNVFNGEVTIGPKVYLANFRWQGLKRRWNFGVDGDDFSYDYAVTIEPTNFYNGAYYDFSTTESGKQVKASNQFTCYRQK